MRLATPHFCTIHFSTTCYTFTLYNITVCTWWWRTLVRRLQAPCPRLGRRLPRRRKPSALPRARERAMMLFSSHALLGRRLRRLSLPPVAHVGLRPPRGCVEAATVRCAGIATRRTENHPLLPTRQALAAYCRRSSSHKRSLFSARGSAALAGGIAARTRE